MIQYFINILTQNWFWVIFTLIWVMFLLNFATSKLEEQLSVIWKKLKIPDGVRGATFDAVSSSLPEFLTAMIALILLKEKGLEVGIWTISGSAIFNILIIPFFALLFYKWTGIIKISKSGINRDVIFYIFSIIVFLTGIYFGELFTMAVSLIVIYMSYIIVLILESRKNYKKNLEIVEAEYREVKDKKIKFFTIFYSLVLVYIWVELSVHTAEFIGKSLWISTMIVSLVLLAAITSIPDTLLSVKASRKWDIDASLSNAVWSNIFDICIGLWLPIIIWIWIMDLHPKVDFGQNIWVFIFLIISTFIYLIVLKSKKLNKKSWIILWILYLVFIAYLVYLSI